MNGAENGTITALPGPAPLMPFAEAVAEVETERVRWLSFGRLALGKITVLDGDPGLGKSTVTLDWAARISTGIALPGGDPLGEPRAVLLLSAEDGKGDTIRPRLEAAGADLRKTFRFVLRDEEGNEHLPSIPASLDALASQIEATHAVLVVVDPLMAYLGGEVKGNNDQDVRRALSPLASMAERYGVAIVVLRHLNKATGMASLYRGGGSIGIIGAARFGLLIAKDPNDETGQRRILAVQKCNIGPEQPSLAFHLEGIPGTDVARVEWEGESPHKAHELTDNVRTNDERAASKEAESWLLDALAAGAVATKQLQKDARDDGISWRALEAIKRRLGVQSGRKGFGPGGSFSWWLPVVSVGGTKIHPPRASAEDAQPSSAPFSAPEKTAPRQGISHTPHTPHTSTEDDDPFAEEPEED